MLSLAGGVGGLVLASGATTLLLRSVSTLMPVPVGQYVQTWRNDPGFTPEALEVVAVVPSLRQDLFDPAPRPHLYVPFSLKPRTWMNYHARVAAGGSGEGAMLEQLRREIRAYDDRLPVLTTKTLRTFVADSVSLWLFRSAARVFAAFGVAALLLALVGIYGSTPTWSRAGLGKSASAWHSARHRATCCVSCSASPPS